MNISEISEQQKQQQIDELGSLLHDEWRALRKQTLDLPFKVKFESSDQIDIANTNYKDLPEDMKGEARFNAESVMNEIYEAISQQRNLDDSFVEETCSIVHDKWLEHSKNWIATVGPKQNKPFDELSEEGKEKYRSIIKKAIEIYSHDAETVL